MSADGFVGRFYGDTSLASSIIAAARATVIRHLDGEARDEVLAMLFDPSDEDPKSTEIEGEESIMNTTPTPSPATIIKATKPEPQEPPALDEIGEKPAVDEPTPDVGDKPAADSLPQRVREWAISHDIAVSTRGRLSPKLVAAYEANDPALVEKPVSVKAKRAPKKPRPKTLAPMTPAVQPPAISEPVEHELAGIQALANGDASLSEKPPVTQGEESDPAPLSEPVDFFQAPTEAHSGSPVSEESWANREEIPIADWREMQDAAEAVGAGKVQAYVQGGDVPAEIVWVHHAPDTDQYAIGFNAGFDEAETQSRIDVAIAEQRQATAENALELVLQAWGREKHRADLLDEQVRLANGALRLSRALLQEDEDSASHEAAIIAHLDRQVAEQADEIKRLRRPWWKRNAS